MTYVIMVVADVLASSRRHAITNHDNNSTMPTQSITVAQQSQKYRFVVIKQIILERGVKVGNPFVSLLLTGSSSHDDNATWQ